LVFRRLRAENVTRDDDFSALKTASKPASGARAPLVPPGVCLTALGNYTTHGANRRFRRMERSIGSDMAEAVRYLGDSRELPPEVDRVRGASPARRISGMSRAVFDV
jgi:hypothetical protein